MLMPPALPLALLGLLALAATPADRLPHAFEAGWRGEPVCEVLHEDVSVKVARCTFPPGVGHEEHFHRPHFGYVLEGGTMRIEDAGGVDTVETRAGGRWTSGERTVHEVLNVGETTTSYLIVETRRNIAEVAPVASTVSSGEQQTKGHLSTRGVLEHLQGGSLSEQASCRPRRSAGDPVTARGPVGLQGQT